MTDVQGGTYADERALADLHATANAPIFAKHTVALGHGIVGGRLMSIAELSRNDRRRGHSHLERRAARHRESATSPRGPAALRLARVTALGHPREPAAAGQRRALSPPDPVAGSRARRAERRRGAGRPVAPDRRAPVSAPRPAARRDREPAEPGSRRRRQPPPDDVGADQLDCP